jgi:hypothetical protein
MEAVITGYIEAHAMQQLAIVPATAEQRGDGRQGEKTRAQRQVRAGE